MQSVRRVGRETEKPTTPTSSPRSLQPAPVQSPTSRPQFHYTCLPTLPSICASHSRPTHLRRVDGPLHRHVLPARASSNNPAIIARGQPTTLNVFRKFQSPKTSPRPPTTTLPYTYHLLPLVNTAPQPPPSPLTTPHSAPPVAVSSLRPPLPMRCAVPPRKQNHTPLLARVFPSPTPIQIPSQTTRLLPARSKLAPSTCRDPGTPVSKPLGLASPLEH